eukprot:1050217-Prymnesium_polylepis.1
MVHQGTARRRGSPGRGGGRRGRRCLAAPCRAARAYRPTKRRGGTCHPRAARAPARREEEGRGGMRRREVEG